MGGLEDLMGLGPRNPPFLKIKTFVARGLKTWPWIFGLGSSDARPSIRTWYVK